MNIIDMFKQLKTELDTAMNNRREDDFITKLKRLGFSKGKSSTWEDNFLYDSGSYQIRACSSHSYRGYQDIYTKYSLSISLFKNGKAVSGYSKSYEE